MQTQNSNKKMVIAIIAILIIAALLVGLKSCTAGKPDDTHSGNISLGVIDLDEDENQNIDLEGMANAIADESMFQVFINSEMVVTSNNQVDFRIQNTENNFHPCYVEIMENQKTLYKSDIINPGYKLESDELDENLEPGVHNCVAYFHVLNDDGNEINKIGVDVTIRSK